MLLWTLLLGSIYSVLVCHEDEIFQDVCTRVIYLLLERNTVSLRRTIASGVSFWFRLPDIFSMLENFFPPDGFDGG